LERRKNFKETRKRPFRRGLNGVKEEKAEMQMSFSTLDDPLLEEIKDEILTRPQFTYTIEAMMKLNEIKRMLTKK
jgi:DNA mismatch repair protein MutS